VKNHAIAHFFIKNAKITGQAKNIHKSEARKPSHYHHQTTRCDTDITTNQYHTNQA